ncbi:BTRF1 [Eptesicus fuscus gammaherpesvirus]|uniref:BTRF1 n=1 Tax=vespertilionid gammaherpesvirus 3 TaxID=2846598 RepID=A0A2D1AEY1_9GAMA|nr:BTRF1 [Eptesicus fuscus gammaherpesvirus]ATA58252.1 BTRF1 [Eptesicus fuscus gammaherpesvirus]WAH70908.1 tegument protein UL88 [Eptesicus fuscus gammaherpesvirus]
MAHARPSEALELPEADYPTTESSTEASSSPSVEGEGEGEGEGDGEKDLGGSGEPRRQVTIAEERNEVLEFSRDDPPARVGEAAIGDLIDLRDQPGQWRPRTAREVYRRAPRSILKRRLRAGVTGTAGDAAPPPQAPPPFGPALRHALIFEALVASPPRAGRGPASAFYTVTVMARSQNSIPLAARLSLTPMQRLFVKHVILHRLGLENVLDEFETLYAPLLARPTRGTAPAARTATRAFERAVALALLQAQVCVRALDDAAASAPPPPSGGNDGGSGRAAPGVPGPGIEIGLEKYFLMFCPENRLSAARAGAAVVRSVCAASKPRTLLSTDDPQSRQRPRRRRQSAREAEEDEDSNPRLPLLSSRHLSYWRESMSLAEEMVKIYTLLTV